MSPRYQSSPDATKIIFLKVSGVSPTAKFGCRYAAKSKSTKLYAIVNVNLVTDAGANL